MKTFAIACLWVYISLAGVEARAQFEGPGNGFPQFRGEAPIIVNSETGFGGGFLSGQVGQGIGTVVVVPKKGNRVLAFSVTTGKWSSVELEEGDVSQVIPAIGNGVAGFRVGRWAYGFSEKAGRWDKIQISRDEMPQEKGNTTLVATPIIGNNVLAMQYERVVCAFSTEHGKWDRVVLPKTSSTQVAVQNHFVTLSDNESFYYAFSNTSHEWGGVDLNSGEMLSIHRELPQ